MTDPFLLPLEHSADLRLVGGKAAGLRALHVAGFPVPRGLCATTALYHQCLSVVGIDGPAEWQALLRAPAAQRAMARAHVHHDLARGTWPPGFRDDLESRLGELSPETETRWAVRSSATNEDAGHASAAGLYSTYLGLTTVEVLQAIRDCWASLWEERVLQYMLRVNDDPPCPSMAVVIQPMVHAVAAGVAYSIHPVTGRTSQVFINAVPGLASALVGGEVAPDQYMVEVDEELCRPIRIRRRQLARKQQKLLITLDGVQAEPIPQPAQQQASLSDGQLHALAQLSKQVERAFGHPIDLEWAWDTERPWLLQARPITGVQPLPTLTDDECEWTRANLKETLPELPSPLGLSFLEQFMDAYIIGPYRRLGCTVPDGLRSVRVLHGRPFLNVTLFYTLVSQLHGNPAFLTEQMGGEPLAFTPRVRTLGAVALLRAGWAIMREWRRVVREGPSSFEVMKTMAETYQSEHVQHFSMNEVRETLDGLGRWLDAHELTYGIAGGVAQSLQAMGTFLPGWLGADWRELLNASLQGQGTVISAQQIVRLAELAEMALHEESVRRWFLNDGWSPTGFPDALAGTTFLQRFEHYLADYGHRAVGESDIMSPRMAEQPEIVLGVIRTQVRTGEVRRAREILSRQVAQRQEALAEITRRFGWRRHRGVIFRWWHRRLTRFCVLREANRHHLMYYSLAVRRLLFRLGEHMVERGLFAVPDDIFYLTMDEQRAMSGGARRNWQGLVRERREERARHEQRHVPDTIRDWEAVVEQNELSPGVQREGVLRGIAISAGEATGPVRVVRSALDWGRVRPGDILVVPVIDPGMAPLFGMAGGVIAEMGGTLSHGAIIAREYGLPVLVNVLDATSLLRENEQVTIVSSTGRIHRAVP
ncbi:MAG: hypothetical protein GDA66_07730 [Nitrospira sp. CR1.2]|nr:hypothetical protein [Nitrospira sp. CR1.2]